MTALALLIGGSSSPMLAHIPPGGLDIYADHWFLSGGQGPRHEPYGHHNHWGFFHGPFRATAYALNISGIDNLVEPAESTAFAGAAELYVMGPFSVGGSFGTADSDTLEWSHAGVQGTVYVTPFFALHLGFLSESYDYPTNLTVATNLASNELNGATAGATFIGSPAPGFFFQLGGHAVPVAGTLVSGAASGEEAYNFQLNGMIGLTVFDSFDLSVMARATNGLGDAESTSVQAGLGASITF